MIEIFIICLVVSCHLTTGQSSQSCNNLSQCDVNVVKLLAKKNFAKPFTFRKKKEFRYYNQVYAKLDAKLYPNSIIN